LGSENLRNNKYKPIEILDNVHHKVKIVAINNEVLMRELATAMVSYCLGNEDLLKQLITKLTKKPTN